MAVSKIRPLSDKAGEHTSSSLNIELDDVRAKLFEWQTAGLPCALVTLVNYAGSSPRPVGSQLVVNAVGERAGLISGGCVEAALIEEAMASLRASEPRLLRYGRDSDFIDIRLPCGSGIDVLLQPNPDKQLVAALYQAYLDRQPITLLMARDAISSEDLNETTTVSADQRLALSSLQIRQTNQQLSRQAASQVTRFTRYYQPRTRIVVIGEGAIFGAFRSLAGLFDLEHLAFSNSEICQAGFHFPSLDAWTAVVTLSHDHDKEEVLLDQALHSEAFHIAALGSQATQAARLAQLRQLGWPEQELVRIKGPAGLDLGGQTPAEIALSIMAEIIGIKNSKLQACKA